MIHKMSRSVILPAYNDNLIRALLGLKVEDMAIPPLGKNEVLVRMKAAPCNPSDIAFLRGGYNIVKPLPTVPGFEGVGEIVESGIDARSLIGKRVSCFVQGNHHGTWAEYFIASASDCIVLKETLDTEQAACLSINPLTAMGMFEMVISRDCKAFIQNAAGGQVPEFLNVLAKKKNINVINLVRKPQHVDQLKSEGNNYVLDTSDENFLMDLSELVKKLSPTLAFDAVAGEVTGQMIDIMPEGSEVVIYGGLSGEQITGIDPMGIIFQKKIISGFNLNHWIPGLSEKEFTDVTDEIQDLFITGEFRTKIQASFPLSEVVKGVRTYIKSMSSGKVLLTP